MFYLYILTAGKRYFVGIHWFNRFCVRLRPAKLQKLYFAATAIWIERTGEKALEKTSSNCRVVSKLPVYTKSSMVECIRNNSCGFESKVFRPRLLFFRFSSELSRYKIFNCRVNSQTLVYLGTPIEWLFLYIHKRIIAITVKLSIVLVKEYKKLFF